MSIGCRFNIHRLTEFQLAFDSLRAQIEELLNLLRYLTIAHSHTATTIGIDINAYRLCHANGIGQLHQHLVGHTCCHHIFGNIAGCIGCGTVYLAGILAREGTTTMTAFAAIGVNNDLASRQTCITMRTANHELSGRIDEILDIIAK